MSLTKPLNSKVNMKQYSNADLPVNPKQPAVARYAAESTASQTVINLPFQVDTVNAADSFMLMVDGKVLTPGATNDYQFSGVDSFGFSSSVTLNYSLSGGLNIQAIKLGLKKETEFVQDARFTALYEGIDQGLQGFIRTADLMLATTATGTPAAGLFHSSVQNRSAMLDLRSDLMSRFGVERVSAQNLYIVPNEFGPNGEEVKRLEDDTMNRVRFVGTWGAASDGRGPRVIPGNLNTDFVEVTFYGTGLNILTQYEASAIDARASVDGGSEGSNIFTASSGGTLQSRGYSSNEVVPVVSGLALGVHTVKIRHNSSTTRYSVYGFEILNEVSTLNVNPGSSYIAGKKLTTIAQQNLALNSSFESGTLGTRGGRVLVYQKADGSIAKAVQPVDAAQANLGAANHQNEEVVRVFVPREFSVNRADDFSGIISNASRAFTLDDGTTTLLGSGFSNNGAVEGIFPNTTGNFITLIFVGTGLDVTIYEDATSTSDTCSISVDGTSVGNLDSVSINGRTRTHKVVSGLPYGTHTVRFTRSTTGSNFRVIRSFTVYQPKKPTLPAGAVELSDYNLMANYTSGIVSGNIEALSAGVLHKQASRELVYIGGGWGTPIVSTNVLGSQYTTSTTIGNYIEYTFFGTGINIIASGGTATVQIDGANYTGAATAVGTGSSWTPGTSTWVGASVNGAGLIISGLSLGLHKVRVTLSAATNFFMHAMHVITPLHSYSNTSPSSSQLNNLIGSMAISDNRKLSALKEPSSQQKAVFIARGVTSNPTTTSLSLIPIPEMSVMVVSRGGWFRLSGYVLGSISSAANWQHEFFINGSQLVSDGTIGPNSLVNGQEVGATLTDMVYLPAGVHLVQIFARVSGGTGTFTGIKRRLIVEEI